MSQGPNLFPDHLARFGKLLNEVYEAGKLRFETKTKISGHIMIEDLQKKVGQGDDYFNGYIKGCLSILSVLGLVKIEDNGSVQATSRYAHFAIGSLSKFMVSSVPIADEPINEDEEKYLIALTSLFETMRIEVKKGLVDMRLLYMKEG